MKLRNAAAFTPSELKFVQDACHELGFLGVVPYLETVEAPNDAIVCAGGFTLVKYEETRVSLTGTAVYAPKYIVSETLVTPATLWATEDYDYRDFAVVDTLAGAVKAMLLRDYEIKLDNTLKSMELAAAYPEEL